MKKITTIKLFPLFGSFAENKDKARDVRVKSIIPTLEKGEDVILDFGGIDSITQSCAHALISDLIRNYGIDVLDRISFANCNDTVTRIVEIVVEYMQ
jgi:hypothetical protein